MKYLLSIYFMPGPLLGIVYEKGLENLHIQYSLVSYEGRTSQELHSSSSIQGASYMA